MNRVAIVGLGLIGGSIAKALRERQKHVFLLAVDRNDVGARRDVQAVVSQFVSIDDVTKHRAAIEESDLVVLCQPVRLIVDTMAWYLTMSTAVTDTGSTKRVVAERAGDGQGGEWFVPGHPMAGKAQGGFEHADPNLFEGRPWVLCSAGREVEAVARVEKLIEIVGARPIVMTPEEHDAATAITSHVPQLLASWLLKTGHDRGALCAAGPAFTDMTRTAGGAEAIWRDIFATNADEVGHRIADAALVFSGIADALLAEPPRIEVVLELLRQARGSNKTR
jgi:prephenate dehydrogenase